MGKLYAAISQLLLTMKNMAPEEMYSMHMRSLTFDESILAGIDLFRFGDITRFNKSGLMLTGIA